MITLPDICGLTDEQATEECYSMARWIGRKVGHRMAITSMMDDIGYDEVGRLKEATIADIRRHFEEGDADPSDLDTILGAIEFAMLREAYIVSCALWLPVGGAA